MRSVSRLARLFPLAAAPLLLQPTAALADDTEFWVELSAKGDIAPDPSFKFELEERRKDGPNEYIVGAVVDRDVGEGFSIGGGMEIHDTGGFTRSAPISRSATRRASCLCARGSRNASTTIRTGWPCACASACS